MFKNKQVRNGLVDAALLLAFLAEFYMSLTGIDLHQWLGLTIGAGALYHLVVHWKWVEAVVERFFTQLNSQARGFAVLDAALLFGLTLIIETGVILSTWLNLALANYETWAAVHTGASIATLGLLVVKLVLHWRWIVKTIASAFAPRAAAAATIVAVATPVPAMRPARPAIPVAAAPLAQRAAAPAVQPVQLHRRQFLTVAGVTSLAALLSVQQVLSNTSGEVQAAADTASSASTTAGSSTTGSSTAAAGSTTTAGSTTAAETETASATATTAAATETASPTAITAAGSTTAAAGSSSAAASAATTCRVRCGKRCAFPGRCGRYTDSNANGRCDLGECA